MYTLESFVKNQVDLSEYFPTYSDLSKEDFIVEKEKHKTGSLIDEADEIEKLSPDKKSDYLGWVKRQRQKEVFAEELKRGILQLTNKIADLERFF
jgi:hypothetical protein